MAADLPIGICSFSFHRLLAAGKQDIFQFIRDCKELGCTQLDPWNAHLAEVQEGDKVIFAGRNPSSSGYLSAADGDYIDQVRAAADQAELPFGCVAVDGAHIYDPDPEVRKQNRERAYRWLEVSNKLGASMVRIDTGGSEELTDEELEVIVDGYKDLIPRAGELGLNVLFENHWGATVIPENVIKVLDAAPGLGLLFDSHNWKPERRKEARSMCAARAKAVHIKTFAFDEQGNETTADEGVAEAIDKLIEVGYEGVWGIESVPTNGDEIAAARDTIALIKRKVAQA
jgi:sugar phosphate isomerase/epimerase